MNWEIFGLVIVAALANSFGGFVIFFKKNWSRKGLNALMALSAGLLLAIAILDLIPKTIEAHAFQPIYVLTGIVTMFFFQKFIAAHFHFGEETHHHDQKSSVVGAFIGLLIHTFFDGLAIVISFQVNVSLGITVLVAVLLHKIPDGITISSIVYAMFQNKKKALWAAIWLGISTIIGALSSSLFVNTYEQIMAIALSFTIGIFLYVASTDLLPAVNQEEDRGVALFFFIGIGLYFILHLGIHELLSLQ